MMKVFNSKEFGQIRTMEVNNIIMFCGSDIAKALGYSDTVNALKQHCKEDGVAFYHITDNLGRNQQAKFISEANMYRLIISSKLPAAQQFENWVFEEILPTIRKTGGVYATAEGIEMLIANPDTTIRLLQTIKAERQEKEALKEQSAKQEAILKSQAPKVEYTDKVLLSESLISTTVIAKELGYSAKRLNELLHDAKVIFNQSGTWVLYSKYQEMGFTKTKTTTFTDSFGNERTQIHTYWTESGRKFIHEMLNKSLNKQSK